MIEYPIIGVLAGLLFVLLKDRWQIHRNRKIYREFYRNTALYEPSRVGLRRLVLAFTPGVHDVVVQTHDKGGYDVKLCFKWWTRLIPGYRGKILKGATELLTGDRFRAVGSTLRGVH